MNNLNWLFLVPTLPKYKTCLCSIFLWKYPARRMQYYAPYSCLSHQTRCYLSQPPSKEYHQSQQISAESDVCSQNTYIIRRICPFEEKKKLWFIQWCLRQDGYLQNHWSIVIATPWKWSCCIIDCTPCNCGELIQVCLLLINDSFTGYGLLRKEAIVVYMPDDVRRRFECVFLFT